MHRPRHPRSSARLSFSLLSVLALLAFVALPAFAQADAGETVYETDIPSGGVKGKEIKSKHPEEKKKKQGNGGSEATASETGSSAEGSETEPETEESSENESQAHPGTTGGGGNKPSGGGNNPGGGNPEAGKPGSVESNKPVAPSSGQQSAQTESGGGSSPLVPILIAIAVLAAISIGAVLYKQRRSDSGSGEASVSPKAS
jgi:cobalamin biosynthesis Mg chelatase CobN